MKAREWSGVFFPVYRYKMGVFHVKGVGFPLYVGSPLYVPTLSSNERFRHEAFITKNRTHMV